jgi:hypothetical protein
MFEAWRSSTTARLAATRGALFEMLPRRERIDLTRGRFSDRGPPRIARWP